MFRWKPKGQRITDFTKLVDGQQVQGYYGDYRIKEGTVERDIDTSYISFSVETISIRFQYKGRMVTQVVTRKYSSDDYWKDDRYSSIRLYTVNLTKENETMANKLMALVKLNKNQRKLAKAGIYDENGNLTPDGQEVVLNLIAKDKEAALVELVKDWKIDKKD